MKPMTRLEWTTAHFEERFVLSQQLLSGMSFEVGVDLWEAPLRSRPLLCRERFIEGRVSLVR